MTDFGFNVIEAYLFSDDDLNKNFAGMAAVRSKRVRILAPWAQLQTAPGIYAWGGLDRAVGAAVAHGLAPLLLLAPFGGTTPGARSPQDYGTFARACAQRYGVERGQCFSYEAMNEMNSLAHYGLGPCDPSGYTTYLRAASVGIRSVLPNADILFGGLAPQGDGFGGFLSMDPVRYLREAYAAGAKGLFTAMSNHPYSIVPATFKYEAPTATQYYMAKDQELRKLMEDKDDGALKTWITEIGFPTAEVPPQKQSEWLSDQFEILVARPYVGPIFIYNWRDNLADRNDVNNTLGVVDYFYAKKVSWSWANTLVPAAANPTASSVGTADVRLTYALTASSEGRAQVDISGPPRALANSEGQGGVDIEYTNVPIPAGGIGTGRVDLAVIVAFAHSFAGSAKPAGFTEFGQGYSVSGGLANANAPATLGYFNSGAIRNADHLTPDHYSEVTQGNGPVSGDRSDTAIVRSSADGLTRVEATGRWGGSGSTQIITWVNGVPTVRATGNVGFGLRDKLRLVPDGKTYTIWKNGVPTACAWVDNDGLYPGAANKKSGFGFAHINTGIHYNAPGLTAWSAADIRGVPARATVDIQASSEGTARVDASNARNLLAASQGAGGVDLLATSVLLAASSEGSGSVSPSAKVALSYFFDNVTPTGIFADFGDDGSAYTVAGGVANNNIGPASNRSYFCGGINRTPLATRTMSVDVTSSNVGAASDRAIMAVANASAPSATADWIGAFVFGFAVAGKIVTKINGVYVERATLSATAFGFTDWLKIVTTLNVTTGVYTYSAYKNGVTFIGSWVDDTHQFTPGLYPGFGFKGVKYGGNYPSAGIGGTWHAVDN